MNFSVEALQEMKNAALRQRMGGVVAGPEVQQSEEISSSQVVDTFPLPAVFLITGLLLLSLPEDVWKNQVAQMLQPQALKISCRPEKVV